MEKPPRTLLFLHKHHLAKKISSTLLSWPTAVISGNRTVVWHNRSWNTETEDRDVLQLVCSNLHQSLQFWRSRNSTDQAGRFWPLERSICPINVQAYSFFHRWEATVAIIQALCQQPWSCREPNVAFWHCLPVISHLPARSSGCSSDRRYEIQPSSIICSFGSSKVLPFSMHFQHSARKTPKHLQETFKAQALLQELAGAKRCTDWQHAMYENRSHGIGKQHWANPSDVRRLTQVQSHHFSEVFWHTANIVKC